MEEKNLELKPKIIRESEFFGGCIRVKISVKNTSGLVIADATLELESDDRILHFDRCEPEYPEKKGKILLGNLDPNTDRTIALYLDPLICAKEGTNVNCRVFYKDAYGNSDMVQMEPLKIKVICPIFRTERDINIGRLKELVSGLSFHDSKVYTIPKRVEPAELLGTCRDVVLLHDVRHIKTFKTTDEITYEAWYYGKTKVTKKDLVIKCCLRRDTESIEVFAAGDDPSDITGLLAEIGRNLAKEFERLGKMQPVFNITIKDSIIQRSNLLSFCDLDGICGGDVVIEDSVVQRANIGLGNEAAQTEMEEAQKREKEEQERLRRQKEQEERAQRERKAREDAESRESERQKARQEEERIAKEREKLSVSETKAGISQIKYLALALVLGVVLLGYWVMAPDSDNTPVLQQPKPVPQKPEFIPEKSTPYPFPNPNAGQKNFTNSIGIEFVLIPAGEFDMSSTSEGPVQHTKISNEFYLGKYVVTQKQWSEVMESNPSDNKDDSLPVDSVSWYDVQEFIKRLNQKEGTNKYQLPTEAEWEYAAWAGTTNCSFGVDNLNLNESLKVMENKSYDPGPSKPNPWGLYDMYGNFVEWMQDGDNTSRVLRNGWAPFYNGKGIMQYDACRASAKGYNPPDFRSERIGFRLLRIL